MVAPAEPGLGRFRVTTRGHLFHHSNGLSGKGYAVCLVCGRAAPMGEDPLPEVFTKPHPKLRGSRADRDQQQYREPCPGSDQPWAIKRDLTFAQEGYTDVLEIQLKNQEGVWINDRKAALTLAVALGDALAELLGVRADELGCDAKDARPGPGARCWSILIFDRFAAGYASSVDRHLDRLFHRARERLDCPAECDSACPHCVLDFNQRFLADLLDRHAALAVLTLGWLDALRLPTELAFFGAGSHAEYAELRAALLREGRPAETRVIRLFGTGMNSDLGPSPLRHLAYRLAGMDRPVEVVLDAQGLATMDLDDRHLLASLADHPGVKVCQIAQPPRVDTGWVIAEIERGGEAVRWALPETVGVRADTTWGTVRPLIVAGALQARTQPTEILTSTDLRPHPLDQGDREVEVQRQLDGPLQGFGERFWAMAAVRHPATAGLLAAGGADVVAVSYQDRYLFNPLSLALLINLIEGLRAKVGQERWADPAIEILTTDERGVFERRSTQTVWSDWPDLRHRDAALVKGFDYVGMTARVRPMPKRQTQHGRRLAIGFSDGRQLSIRLDQGVSYWRLTVAYNGDGRGRYFEFQADPERQAEAVATMAGNVEGAMHPTQLFLSVIAL
jgi:DEAD/DEAH box helicase domain-containing protein